MKPTPSVAAGPGAKPGVDEADLRAAERLTGSTSR